MLEWLSDRVDAFWSAIDRPKWKGLLIVWAVIGVYDQFADQIAPSWLEQHMPKVRDMISVTTGWLPWWAWLWIGTAIIAAASIEYAARLSSPIKSRALRTVARLAVHVGDMGQKAINSSTNIAHLEVTDDGRYIVEFQTPIKHPSRLTARVGEKPLALTEATKFRAMFEPLPDFDERMSTVTVLFESDR